ncbi:helix-turn-helix domain-containing protein [Desertihabitans brevis]|uniref:helix-turn-helix domain-containing protein n=1 Tax=Desertihabitans brevis TaxID=2268447 RepID=UPI001F18D303|nr:helix-turn-helix transcriptional regulator [Desertihabitans brevis]
MIAPFVKVSPVRISSSQRAHIRPTLPRHRQFAPLRAEARRAAELLHRAPEEPWTLGALAARVHLSPSQLSRVFTDAYGKTPLAYLTMLRAEHLAKSLRETDLPIETAMRQVGWRSRGHAAQQFRKYVGLTPTQYRQLTLRAS